MTTVHTFRVYNERRSVERASARAEAGLQHKMQDDFFIKLFTQVGRPASHKVKGCHLHLDIVFVVCRAKKESSPEHPYDVRCPGKLANFVVFYLKFPGLVATALYLHPCE
jgi:hypothetical protein